MTRSEILQIAKPILFNTDEVRAILDNRKTAKHLLIKLKYRNTHHEMFKDKYGTRLVEIQNDVEGETFGRREDGTTWCKLRGYIEPKPPYRKGQYLYVRETWCWCPCWDCGMDTEEHGCCDKTANKSYNEAKKEWGCYGYKALFEDNEYPSADIWHPSIHMPKEAARIFLRVTYARTEQLKDMSYIDFLKEGIVVETKGVGVQHIAEQKYRKLWNATIPKKDLDKYGWDANPWVWVIEFERMKPYV